MKFRIVKNKYNRFRVQEKGLLFWNDLGKLEGFRVYVTRYFSTFKEAEAALNRHIKRKKLENPNKKDQVV